MHEWMNEIILRNMSEESQKNMTPLKHTTIELASGVVAGIAAATLSQVWPFLDYADCSLRIPFYHRLTRGKEEREESWKDYIHWLKRLDLEDSSPV